MGKAPIEDRKPTVDELLAEHDSVMMSGDSAIAAQYERLVEAVRREREGMILVSEDDMEDLEEYRRMEARHIIR